MFSRRDVLRGGLGAAGIGLLAKHGFALNSASDLNIGSGAVGLARTRPFRYIPFHPQSVMVDGLPFAEWFTGDFFSNDAIPFHTCQNCFENGEPPAPTEETDLVIVGGGLSGLTTAFLAREYNPVLLELRPRFGGVAQGEIWGGTPFSLGTAYVITPDSGSYLDWFYDQLGLAEVIRKHTDANLIEYEGQIWSDFWTGAAKNPKEMAAYQQYAAIVQQMANVDYPDIPLPDGDVQWILDLDRKTLKEDIESKMNGFQIPPLLAGAIQAYCYSSFNAGWEEISAAGGWNFLAAEEFGRWVPPGGITYMVDALWKKLIEHERAQGRGEQDTRLRAGCKVVDVRLVAGKRAQVTYYGWDGKLRSLLAKRVAMCCPKYLCKYMIPGLEKSDPQRLNAMNSVLTRAYIVGNVLLDSSIKLDFYDIFLLRDGHFPMAEDQATDYFKVVDMLSGHYARRRTADRSVLTLYFPLPFDTGRFTLVTEDPWTEYAERFAPQIRSMLDLLNVPHSAVKQVRMARWGHSMPINYRGLIADGITDTLRRPIDETIYFINQDNWALPAVENCILDAEIFVPRMTQGL